MITHGFTSTSRSSTSAMTKKSRSRVSRGTPCSTDAAAIRQSCRLRMVRPRQRHRAYSSPALRWVSRVTGRQGNSENRCRRMVSSRSPRAPWSSSWTMTGSNRAHPLSSQISSFSVDGVRHRFSQSIHTQRSIRYTPASGVAFGDDVVVRVDQLHALKLLELAQPVLHDQIVQCHLHHFSFGLGAGKLHGLGHQFIVEHDIGSHHRTPPNVHCSR